MRITKNRVTVLVANEQNVVHMCDSDSSRDYENEMINIRLKINFSSCKNRPFIPNMFFQVT